MKFFDMANTDLVSNDNFKIKSFLHSISMPVGKITDDPHSRRIINSTIDPQTDMVQYFIL
jgi:hypothetical protein